MAHLLEIASDPYGNRTHVAAVKGRCPRPLDEGADHCAQFLSGHPQLVKALGPRPAIHCGFLLSRKLQVSRQRIHSSPPFS